MGSPLRNILHPYEFGAVFGKTVTSAGTSFLLARHYQGKKDVSSGKLLGLAAGGKLLAAFGRLFGLGEEAGLVDVGLGTLDAVGQGAVDFLSVWGGLATARKEKHLRVIAVPDTADVAKLPAGSMLDAPLVGDQVALLGELGRAQPGSTMNRDKVRTLQMYR